MQGANNGTHTNILTYMYMYSVCTLPQPVILAHHKEVGRRSLLEQEVQCHVNSVYTISVSQYGVYIVPYFQYNCPHLISMGYPY